MSHLSNSLTPFLFLFPPWILALVLPCSVSLGVACHSSLSLCCLLPFFFIVPLTLLLSAPLSFSMQDSKRFLQWQPWLWEPAFEWQAVPTPLCEFPCLCDITAICGILMIHCVKVQTDWQTDQIEWPFAKPRLKTLLTNRHLSILSDKLLLFFNTIL